MASITASASLEFAASLRQEVDAALAECVDDGDDCPGQLADAIRYSLLAPGKRLRPMLVLLAAESCGCERGQAMSGACAVEMMHAYSLVHDDLPAMDDDDLRRGRATCHIQFDQATAILAGDAMLTQAFAVLASAPWSSEVKVQCMAELARAAGTAGMVGGQVDDLAAEREGLDRDSDTEDEIAQLYSIHRRKTGAMIGVSLRLGGIVAGASDEQLLALTTYGEKLGLAFQITDDLLDFSGDEQTLGKRTQKDAQRGKLTFPGLLGAPAAADRAKQLIDEACDSLAPFGQQASRLEALARYVMERKH